MPLVEFNFYWGWRNLRVLDMGQGNGNENLAFMLCARYAIHRDGIHDIIEDLRKQSIVPNAGFLLDRNLSDESTWDMAWSFNLCPCIEMYYPTEIQHRENLTWRIIE